MLCAFDMTFNVFARKFQIERRRRRFWKLPKQEKQLTHHPHMTTMFILLLFAVQNWANSCGHLVFYAFVVAAVACMHIYLFIVCVFMGHTNLKSMNAKKAQTRQIECRTKQTNETKQKSYAKLRVLHVLPVRVCPFSHDVLCRPCATGVTHACTTCVRCLAEHWLSARFFFVCFKFINDAKLFFIRAGNKARRNNKPGTRHIFWSADNNQLASSPPYSYCAFALWRVAFPDSSINCLAQYRKLTRARSNDDCA